MSVWGETESLNMNPLNSLANASAYATAPMMRTPVRPRYDNSVPTTSDFRTRRFESTSNLTPSKSISSSSAAAAAKLNKSSCAELVKAQSISGSNRLDPAQKVTSVFVPLPQNDGGVYDDIEYAEDMSEVDEQPENVHESRSSTSTSQAHERDHHQQRSGGDTNRAGMVRHSSVALHAVMDGVVPVYQVVEEAWERQQQEDHLYHGPFSARMALGVPGLSRGIVGGARLITEAAIDSGEELPLLMKPLLNHLRPGGGGASQDEDTASPSSRALTEGGGFRSPLGPMSLGFNSGGFRASFRLGHAGSFRLDQQQFSSGGVGSSPTASRNAASGALGASMMPPGGQSSSSATVTTVRTFAELEDIEQLTRQQYEAALFSTLEHRHELVRHYMRRKVGWTAASMSIQRAEGMLRRAMQGVQANDFDKMVKAFTPVDISAVAVLQPQVMSRFMHPFLNSSSSSTTTTSSSAAAVISPASAAAAASPPVAAKGPRLVSSPPSGANEKPGPPPLPSPSILSPAYREQLKIRQLHQVTLNQRDDDDPTGHASDDAATHQFLQFGAGFPVPVALSTSVKIKEQLFELENVERSAIEQQMQILWPRLALHVAEMYHRAEVSTAARLAQWAAQIEFDALFRHPQRALKLWTHAALEMASEERREHIARCGRRFAAPLQRWHLECRDSIRRRSMHELERAERARVIDQPAAVLASLLAEKRRIYRAVQTTLPLPWDRFEERWAVVYAGEVPARRAIEAEETQEATRPLTECETLSRAILWEQQEGAVVDTAVSLLMSSIRGVRSGAGGANNFNFTAPLQQQLFHPQLNWRDLWETFASWLYFNFAEQLQRASAAQEQSDPERRAHRNAANQKVCRRIVDKVEAGIVWHNDVASRLGQLFAAFTDFERVRRDETIFFETMVRNSLTWFFEDVRAHHRRGFVVTSQKRKALTPAEEMHIELWRQVEFKRHSIGYHEELEFNEICLFSEPLKEKIVRSAENVAAHAFATAGWSLEMQWIVGASEIIKSEAALRFSLLAWTSRGGYRGPFSAPSSAWSPGSRASTASAPMASATVPLFSSASFSPFAVDAPFAAEVPELLVSHAARGQQEAADINATMQQQQNQQQDDDGEQKMNRYRQRKRNNSTMAIAGDRFSEEMVVDLLEQMGLSDLSAVWADMLTSFQ